MTSSNLAASYPQPREPRRAGDEDRPRLRRSSADARPERPRSGKPLAVIIATLVAANVAGLPYYASSAAERVRHPWHAWLKSSGYIGQSAGILALLIFLFLWLYPFRKKYRWLAFTGSVGRWLDVHVLAALSLPLLLALHAAWRFDGIIGLGYASILVVCASGIVGRYIYARIPRSRNGIELTRDEAAAQRQALLERIATTTGLELAVVEQALELPRAASGSSGVLQLFLQLPTNDLARWRLTRQLRRRWMRVSVDGRPLSKGALKEVVRLARREIALTQQSRMLEATQRIFRFWHVAHRPFAVTALIAVLVHVAVVVAIGATWLW
jgi:hypothetical protein